MSETSMIDKISASATTTWRYSKPGVMLQMYRFTFARLRDDPRARVRMFWSSPPLDLAGFRREFLSALHRRINRKVAPVPRWRKLAPDWQVSAMRDRGRLQDIAKRIRVYQFETDDVRRRFGERLSRYDD